MNADAVESGQQTALQMARGYQLSQAVYVASARRCRSFGELLHTVCTGQTAFERVYGAPLFGYYVSHPDVEASAAARMLRTCRGAMDEAARLLIVELVLPETTRSPQRVRRALLRGSGH